MALANAHETTRTLPVQHATDQEEPHPDKHQAGHDPRQQVPQQGAFHHASVGHTVPGKSFGQVALDAVGDDGRLAVGFTRFQRAGERGFADDHLGHATVGQRLFERAVGHRLHRARGLPRGLNPRQGQQRQQPIAKIPLNLLMGLHPIAFSPVVQMMRCPATCDASCQLFHRSQSAAGAGDYWCLH
ncbi:hypothetical protein D9M68_820650 [compost metagenome]